MKKYLIALIISIICIACNQTEKSVAEPAKTETSTEADKKEPPKEPNSLEAKGEKITQALGKSLISTLAAAIADSGIIYAAQFCKMKALPITDSISTAYGATVQRVSHRNRNPENAVNKTDMAVITNYKQLLTGGSKPKPMTVEDDGKVLYYAPIVLNNPMCLKCHGIPGKDIDPDDLSALLRLYPNDQATTFKLGDLRGLWKVSFNKPL